MAKNIPPPLKKYTPSYHKYINLLTYVHIFEKNSKSEVLIEIYSTVYN